jgi:DNA polymerase-3 subunit delta
VKASKGSIGRSVDQPGAGIRFYLFHGPDEAQSRALAARLLEAVGATKFLITAGSIKSDPAALVDEAGAMSLFGGKRLIWIEPATKDVEDGVAALLEAREVESPVVAIAGALPRTSALLKLAEAAPQAIAFASYVPEGQDAERMVIDVGRRFGLKIDPPVAARLADSSGNDQAIVAQELQKLALYVDASPQAPKELDHAAIDDIGADSAEGDFQRLADLAMGGELRELADELAVLPAGGSEAIPVIRSLQRRLLMLAPARARVERGENVDSVMTSLGKSLFWKDKAKVERMISKWTAADLATVAERAGRLERELMRQRARPNTSPPEPEALGEELISIARKARSAR